MEFQHASLFILNPSSKRWLIELIDYVTASFTNPELWELIQELALQKKNDWIAQMAKLATEQGKEVQAVWNANGGMPYEYADPGMFASIEFFLDLSYTLYERGEKDDYAGGSLDSVGRAFELLLEAGIIEIRYDIIHRDTYRRALPAPRSQHYDINEEFVKYLVENDLLYNYLFGINYIIEKYTQSVVKIEVEQNGDIALGTGWLYDIKTNDPANPIIRLVITNNHVLDKAQSIKVYSKQDSIIAHYEVELLEQSTGLDIACLRVDYNSVSPSFILEPQVELLEEIITIGYPSVPLSREAYQLVHRGDVNAQVKDYHGNDLLIISARTAPGSSGSPVIDGTGRVVGMAARQLFERKAFEEKGITPYSACIPAVVLAKAIHESALVLAFIK